MIDIDKKYKNIDLYTIEKTLIGIKDGKVFDKCSDYRNRRTKDMGIDINPETVDYYLLDYPAIKYMDIIVGDTWVGEDKPDISKTLKDAPRRSIPRRKSYLERIAELETKNTDLEARILAIESK